MIKKILLAEDDPDDRDMVLEILSGREDIHLMRSVSTGVELITFLEYLSQDDQLPDLIILDQNMPRMNGKETLKLLRASSRYSKIPVVVFTTDSANSFARECMRLGATMVATKPDNVREFQEMVLKFLPFAENYLEEKRRDKI